MQAEPFWAVDAAQHLDPVGAGGGAAGLEYGIAVGEAGETADHVCMAEKLLGTGLQEAVAEEQGVKGVGEERVVGYILGSGRGGRFYGGGNVFGCNDCRSLVR